MLSLGVRANALQLRRVRLRGAADSLRTRQRLELVLSEVVSSSLDVATQALLVVRRFASGRLQPDSVGMRRFGQAVRGELERVARRARRPWLDPGASGAEAVLFSDEAELVACLVRDWLRGAVAERWWWRTVLGDTSPRDWLRRHVLVRGELMIPAIRMLAAGPDAGTWLARLEDSEAEVAMAVIARSHALSSDVVQEGSVERRRMHDPQLPSVKSDASSQSRPAALRRLADAVPEVFAPALRPPQRRLAAAALALARAPSWARTPQLALALRELEHEVAVAVASQVRVMADRPRAVTMKLSDERASAIVDASIHETLARPVDPLHEIDQAVTRAKRKPEPFEVLARREKHVASLPIPDTPRAFAQTASDDAPTKPTEIALALAPKPALEQATPVDFAGRVHTEFGGIFYLLNAALGLKLYADFTSPSGSNLRISPWDWLALVGRAWFGLQFVRDPVWKLLAELAGRQRRYLRRPRWLKAQIETLLARLALALGEERSADIPALVCRHRAGIVTSASRVDVHLALAELPLALRIAGLDRDPGWIPAAGRSVAFHFE
jgi:hypothetical protein